ncbi:hypothetical protein A5746_10325 [Mycolicibacterium conceptionense]|nr:hypothetical protein A5639_20645 [Mycolicibacterium conceptionense]OMB90412.1 hypothetical protein A5741_12210 [Mycolicibacterium conceptionense]OMC02098.1 hypothetical protein A5746_10325 [Mycolicibacterium conceptionense]
MEAVIAEALARWYGNSVRPEFIRAAGVVLAALKSARIAVVELPESDGEDDDGQEYFGDFGIRVDHTARGSEYPLIYLDGRPSNPEAVRREAADLLAAADAAEASR